MCVLFDAVVSSVSTVATQIEPVYNRCGKAKNCVWPDERASKQCARKLCLQILLKSTHSLLSRTEFPLILFLSDATRVNKFMSYAKWLTHFRRQFDKYYVMFWEMRLLVLNRISCIVGEKLATMRSRRPSIVIIIVSSIVNRFCQT